MQFRKWATNIIESFTIKGFAMDDERLKNGGSILGKKYFEEQLQRIREIQLIERTLSEDRRHLRHRHRLRSHRRRHQTLLCHSAKQSPLGHPRPNGVRGRSQPLRRHQEPHGTDHLEVDPDVTSNRVFFGAGSLLAHGASRWEYLEYNKANPTAGSSNP